MAVPTTIADLSTTAALNSPAGSDNLSTADDYLRAIQGIVKTVYTDSSARSETLTNKTVALGSNTVSGTFAQFNTAVTDAELARTDAANTFTGTQTFGDVTTTGNTILGNASTDTLNVGNGGLIKDASGNVGIGVTPSAWGGGYLGLQVGRAAIMGRVGGENAFFIGNAYYDGTSYKYTTTGKAEVYALNAGAHSWLTAPSGTAGTTATFTEAMTLDASGGLKTLNTIGVGNATPSTSGAGITFPATQSASTDANTLDDYEEGSFTPTITASVTNPTNQPSLAVGRYTKIGGLVTLSLEITGINMAGSSGYLKVSSLPFANGGALYYKTTGSCYFNSIDTPAGSVNIVPFLANSASEVSFVATIDNAASQNVTDNATTGGQIYMSIAYRTT